MKKITLFLFTILVSVSAFAQFTFPTDAGPYLVTNPTITTISINDAGNSAGVTSGVYGSVSVTVSWQDNNTAWSSEAQLSVTTSTGSTFLAGATSGAADTATSTTLTFDVLLDSSYDPDVNGTLSINLSQTFTSSSANWSNIIVVLSPYVAPPNCAEMPISPTEGATGVSVGTPVTVTWSAPSSGDAPTSYDFYAGLESDGSDLALVTNVATPTADITFDFYNTTYYWQVRPKNVGGAATGCSLSSFTTESFAGSTPTTLQTITINTCGDSQVATNAYDSGVEGIQWIELVYSGGCDDVVIDTESTTGFNDTELGIYNSEGNLIFTNDDIDVGGGNFLSSMTLTGIEAGTYYIAAGAYNVAFGSGYNVTTNSTTDVGSMVINFASGATTLSLNDNAFESFTYFPNPVNNKLTLKAQQNIQNVSVFNMLGQEVMRTEMNLQRGELDMSSLQSGPYFVKVSINGTIETIKIIKK